MSTPKKKKKPSSITFCSFNEEISNTDERKGAGGGHCPQPSSFLYTHFKQTRNKKHIKLIEKNRIDIGLEIDIPNMEYMNVITSLDVIK